MARRSAVDLVAEAFVMADRQLSVTAGTPGACVPRDVLALGLYLPLVEHQERMRRDIRRARREMRKRLRRQDRRIAEVMRLVEEARERVEAAAGKPGEAAEERRYVTFTDDDWMRTHLAQHRVPDREGS